MLKRIIIASIILICSFTVNGALESKILVKAFAVKEFKFYDKFISIGQVSSEKNRIYNSSISGRLDFLSKKQGDNVKKGEVILIIDNDIAQSIKTQAESSLSNAKLTYERDQTLMAKKIISTEVLEKSKMNFEIAKLAYEKNMKIYDDMVIKAPFDGQIGVIKANIGDQINIGDYLFNLVENKSEKNIFIELPESLYKMVFKDMKVKVKDSRNNQFKGKIEASSDYLSNNGTIIAKIIIEDSDNLIYGSYAEVELVINEHQNIGLPEKAILQNDNGSFIYKIEDNVVKQLYVNLGTRTDDMMEILSSELKEGDSVVLEGLTKLQDGMNVQLIEAKVQ